MSTSKASRLASLLTIAAAGAALVVPASASAQNPLLPEPPAEPPVGFARVGRQMTCFGRAPTLVVRAQGLKLVVYGTDGDDVIIGSAGEEEIYGLGGRDLICSRGGDDLVYGGGGDDMLDGGAGSDLVAGWGGDDVVIGGGGNDILRGNEGDDVVYGGAGDDSDINLGPGADWGFGGAGDDRVSGYGDGPLVVDNCYGGDGVDRARNCDAPFDPTVGLFAPWTGNQFEAVGPASEH